MTSQSPIPTDRDGGPMEQVVLSPRRRVFLEQTFADRVRGVCWSVVWALLFRRTPESFNAWRVLLLRLFGARIGPRVFVHPSVRVQFPWNLRVEEGVHIAHNVIITCMGEVSIGAESMISQYAHLIAGTHDYARPDMQILRRPIVIGRGVWIAADAFVGPGVTIGDGSLLAARSSAFRTLPPGMVCVGEPAKPVKPRESGSTTSSSSTPSPWNTSLREVDHHSERGGTAGAVA